jgi:hypothetical protein
MDELEVGLLFNSAQLSSDGWYAMPELSIGTFSDFQGLGKARSQL